MPKMAQQHTPIPDASKRISYLFVSSYLPPSASFPNISLTAKTQGMIPGSSMVIQTLPKNLRAQLGTSDKELPAESEALDCRSVAFNIILAQICQQSAPASNELEQTPP